VFISARGSRILYDRASPPLLFPAGKPENPMRIRSNEIKLATAIGAILTSLVLARPTLAVDVIDDPMQIDEDAADVVQTANSLCWELHRYHRQQPEFAPTYRTAKEIWARAGDLRDALRNRPVETESLVQQVSQMNDMLAQVDKTLSRWGDGDRSLVPLNAGPRTVVAPRVAVDIPFVGVRVGGPRVYTEEGPPVLERRRLHPNSHGSKRGLERELAALKPMPPLLVPSRRVTHLPWATP
jgi:hypothetical protein